MMIVLLILFVLDGEAHTLAVKTDGQSECVALQSMAPEILPKLIGKAPQFYAPACAKVKLLATDI